MLKTPLYIDKVSKSFSGKIAVEDVSFTINPGEIIGFLGPNGAGKTTTLRMALGLIKPDLGTIKTLGETPGSEATFGKIGFLPEERGLYKKQTAIDSIALMAQLNGVKRKEAYKAADMLLDKYGLSDAKKKKNKDMSKGMAQKVQLLSVMAHNPEFYILDEPFSGLDPVNQQVLEKIVKEIAKRDSTVIFSTHVMEHAERLCDRIILMAEGRKIFDGTTKEALSKAPRRIVIGTKSDKFVETLTGLTKFLEIRSDGAYDLILNDNAQNQDVLERCVSKKIELSRFEPIKASLHEAFVAMVGADKLTGAEFH
ncbi:ATP-binding cassette domain-containing protein [Hellea sp.]|nr:ATP-binding cassette domain-containing protein [Hellea sp.]